MSFDDLTKLFGKKGGQVDLFDRPKSKEDMKHYLLALEKNKRCKSPNWDCEDGLVCDVSNFFNKPSGDGVCISQKTADSRKFKQINYKGHKIVGSAKTIQNLEALLKKDSDTPDSDTPDSDSDTPDSGSKIMKCKSPTWCEGDFVCDVSSGYPGVCVPSDKYDKSLSSIDFNGKKIVGTEAAIQNLKDFLKKDFEKIPLPMTPKEPAYPPPVTPPIKSPIKPIKSPIKSPIKDKKPVKSPKPEDDTPVGGAFDVDDLEDLLKKIQLPEDQKIDKLAKSQNELLKCLGLLGK